MKSNFGGNIIRWTVPTARGVARLISRLARDRGGNTLMIVAFSIVPLLAMVGGGIDMGRAYLTETRLQQACDAGVLAARKQLGSQVALAGAVPASVQQMGDSFFNINFQAGDYGSTDRAFAMTLENDYAITGQASATVPTTVMRFFSFESIPVAANCRAELSFPNTDVMMVLDVTGSMNETLPGDSRSKIASLRDVVTSFHTQLEAAKKGGSRIRYGFLPYSTNVNVGGLLQDDWVVDQWTYQSRVLNGTGSSPGMFTYFTASSPVSGGLTTTIYATYPAVMSRGRLTCPTIPANTAVTTTATMGTTTEPVVGPPAGTRTRTTFQRTTNGITYSSSISGTTCTITASTYTNYIVTYDRVTEPSLTGSSKWDYKPITRSVTNWRAETAGCMEERDTYEIHDYNTVDFRRAPDLDIDTVPTPGDSATQWRPMYPQMIFGRDMKWDGTGRFSIGVSNTSDEFIAPYLANTAACPPPAHKLAEMTDAEVNAYVGTLVANGSTYHDIGMIWGGRLLSRTGLFAAENADIPGQRPTQRHMIFLTDGQTSSLDISYSSYGFEPIDRRRWSTASTDTLTQTVEKRFSFACEEVKKRNITVWVIAFGTDLNPIMTNCAGAERSFKASDSSELSAIFVKIANSMSDLRITE